MARKKVPKWITAVRDSRPGRTAVGPALRWQVSWTRAEDAGRQGTSGADSSLRRGSARRPRADAGRCGAPDATRPTPRDSVSQLPVF